MTDRKRVRLYATRWWETICLIVLTLLSVLKENALLAGRPTARDWFDLAYFPIFAAMFIWFVVTSISGAILCSQKNDKAETIEFSGWLLINACGFLAMTVYVMWHRG